MSDALIGGLLTGLGSGILDAAERRRQDAIARREALLQQMLADRQRAEAVEDRDFAAQLSMQEIALRGQNAQDVQRMRGKNALDVAETRGQNAQDVQRMRGQNALDVAETRGQTALDVQSMRGQNAQDVQRMRGQNALDVQGMRGQNALDVQGVSASQEQKSKELDQKVIRDRQKDVQSFLRAYYGMGDNRFEINNEQSKKFKRSVDAANRLIAKGFTIDQITDFVVSYGEELPLTRSQARLRAQKNWGWGTSNQQKNADIKQLMEENQAYQMQLNEMLKNGPPAIDDNSLNLNQSSQILDLGKPLGTGTRADPYRVTNQQEVDWVKNNTSPGTMIKLPNGKIYSVGN